MSERVPFNPKRTCACPIRRTGRAGVVAHRAPCEVRVDWLAQSGEVIIPGRRYRWINNDDQWAQDRGYRLTNVVAEVTRVNAAGMVYALWNDDRPDSEYYGRETCIPNSAVVELVRIE